MHLYGRGSPRRGSWNWSSTQKPTTQNPVVQIQYKYETPKIIRFIFSTDCCLQSDNGASTSNSLINSGFIWTVFSLSESPTFHQISRNTNLVPINENKKDWLAMRGIYQICLKTRRGTRTWQQQQHGISSGSAQHQQQQPYDVLVVRDNIKGTQLLWIYLWHIDDTHGGYRLES